MDFDKDKSMEEIKANISLEELEAFISSKEARAELADKLCETLKHVCSLGEAIDMLLDDLGPAAMILCDVGIVISLNVTGENVFSLARGSGSSVKRAIADIVTHIVNDTDKED